MVVNCFDLEEQPFGALIKKLKVGSLLGAQPKYTGCIQSIPY